MSSHDNHTIIAPNGCPIDSTPPDPTHLFSSNGINLDLPRVGWILSGILTVLSTGISLVLIFRHYQYYTKPDQQRYIVRMLLMVPIYAITSWFSFVYVREAVYYDSIRVLYEAFVIASFFILMLQYMGSTLEDQRKVLRQHKKTERWFFPMCCLKYNPSRPHFLQYMKWGILQYVPLNILGTILTIVLESQGNYCENSWNPKFGHIWVLGSYTISVTIATYFLIMFYFTIRLELKQYDPFYKFLAVKLVVFFSFWQMVVIEGLVYFGLIKGTTYWSTNDISTGINAVLIDIEMVFFAIMHLRAFSYKPYVPKIPNPELGKVEDTAEVKLLEDNHPDQQSPDNSINNNNNNRRNERPGRASLDSIDMNEIPARKGTRPSANQGHPKDGSQSQPKSKKQGSGKKGKKDKGPPETVLDFTQKTPIWRGLIDSFNPLDLIRELAYGVKYMYRWARGIPVDKDSKRLLDLEKAFGRVRPEVPYVPPKEKKKKNKKKKKTWWGGKKTDSEGEDEDDNSKASGDDDEDEDDKEDDNSDIGSGKRKDWNNDQDYEKTLGEGKRRKNDRELYDSDLEENRRGQDYRSDHTTRGQRSKMKMDSAYDMGYDPGRNALGRPIRNDTMARGSGSEHGYASIGRKSARPIAAAAGGASSSGAGVNSLGKAAGKATGKTQQQTLHKMGSGSAAFLTKDEASHTERATLPDIQPGPVPKKFALSGFDESIPLPSRRVPEEDRASTTTSFDVPMPAASTIPVPYRPTRQHPVQSSEDYYYEKPRLHSERRHGEHDIVDMEPVRVEGRGAPRPFDYDRFAFDPSFSSRNPRSSGGTFGRERPTNLTQHKNTNFVSKDDPGRFEDFRNSRSTGAETFGYSHGRLDSGETSPFPMSTTSSERESVRRHFYHLRDGSHSDPELSHYGNSHEFYVEQLHIREPQDPLQNQERSKGKTVIRAQEDKETVELAPGPAPSTRRENDPGNAGDAVVVVVEDSNRLTTPSRLEDPKLPDHEDHSVSKNDKLKQEEEEEEVAAAEIVDNEPVARIDPIVAEYSIIQRRQQELQQQNQDQKQEQDQHRQRQPQQLQPQSRQSSTVSRQQPRQLLLRRRNSLDSVDSARSSSSGGGPRYARRMYMRDYYSGIGHRQPIAPLPALPMHIPMRSNRQGFPVEDFYGRTYGYSMRMPEPQYIPPSRYYRFHPEPDIPVDRSRGGREGDGYSGRPWPEPERGPYYPPPPAPTTRQLPPPIPSQDGPMPMQMPEPMQEQRFFMPVPEHERYDGHDRSPPTLPQAYSNRPGDSGPRLGGPVPHKRRDEGSTRGSNLRYQSPPTGRVVEPPVPLPPSDRQEQYRPRPGASSRYQEWNRDREWERERERDRGRDRDPRYYAQDPRTVRDPYGATPESLYPVSRYAAPYLRDYEYRQREETRRQRGPP